MINRIELADEITAFLDRHAKLAADFDPRFDAPSDRFNGPDSAMLYLAAEGLRTDVGFPHPLSSFGSGCYQPITDKAAAAWHDEIIVKIVSYISAQTVAPGF